MTYYFPSAPQWLQHAEQLLPTLRETVVRPCGAARLMPDPVGFAGWKSEQEESLEGVEKRSWTTGESFMLDFGTHQVGYLSFGLRGIGEIDSPVRLRLVFAEEAFELAEPFDPFSGVLSRAWLQDETLTFDDVYSGSGFRPVVLPRRYAFRYVKVEIVAAGPFRICLADFKCRAVTSADETEVEPVALPAPWSDMEAVACRTLRNCMQTVFEDGPKRDRRLWVGDLRLQSLVNSVTFRNFDLVRRCLYLFAGLSGENGHLCGCLYERPVPHGSSASPVDYPLLFAAILFEYASESDDWETVRELFPVALRQLDFGWEGVDGAGNWHAREGEWLFIDWNDALLKEPAVAGVLAFSINRTIALAEAVGCRDEIAPWRERLALLVSGTRAAYWDAARRTAVSEGQTSWLSQAWLTLCGILSREEGAAALRLALDDPQALRPLSPYGCHTVIEALLSCGMEEDASRLLYDFWGGMVKVGFTTFPEVWNPVDHRTSPYGNPLLNSACHAWSCTPAYFLRRWPRLAGMCCSAV